MSRSQQKAKQTPKWQSFFQDAVAGIESRLDNILAEGDEVPDHAATRGHDGHQSDRGLDATVKQDHERYQSDS